MEFFGVGPLELLLIVVLALIVFGPARLPEIMGQIGRAIADFRRATSQLSDEFNRTIQTELNETRQAVEQTRAVLNEAKSSVTEAHAAVTTAVAAVPAPPRVAAPAGTAAVSTNGTTVEPHAEPNGTAAAAAPPLADTSQWSWESSSPAPGSASPTSPSDSAAPAPAPGPSIPGTPGGSSTPNAEGRGQDGGASSSGSGSSAARSARQRGPLRDEILPPY